ncbi:MAG: hypothetical protein ABI635_08200 [Actinomycetota bacterium]
MKSTRRLLAAALVSLALSILGAKAAVAQVINSPGATPVINKSPTGPLGPLPSLAAIMFGVAVLVVVLLILAYMRYAPHFGGDEESVKVVRADRVRLGRELPRRSVDVSQAVPVVVAPPALPVAVGATAPAPVPAAPAAAPAAPAEAAAVPAEAPAASAAATPPAPTPEAAARPEVALDETVFQTTLEELLSKGTDRRVAEGQARRAAMIAARKAAGG